MSIPSTKPNLGSQSMTMTPRMSTSHVEKYEKAQNQAQHGVQTQGGVLKSKITKQQIILAASSHVAKRRYAQSKQSVEGSSEDKEPEEQHPAGTSQVTFRSRSKTVSDATSEFPKYSSLILVNPVTITMSINTKTGLIRSRLIIA